MGVLLKVSIAPTKKLENFASLNTDFGSYTRRRFLQVFPTDSYFNIRYNHTLPLINYPDKLEIPNSKSPPLSTSYNNDNDSIGTDFYNDNYDQKEYFDSYSTDRYSLYDEQKSQTYEQLNNKRRNKVLERTNTKNSSEYDDGYSFDDDEDNFY